MLPSIEQEIRDLHALFGSPRDPEGRAFVPLADAYRRSGDPSRALEILADGLDRHPALAAGHLVAGLTRRDLADDAGAEAAFRKVLELDGDNARALVGLGRIVRAQGDETQAEALMARALALDPLLGRDVAPDRVPRHSTNPEVVGVMAREPDDTAALGAAHRAEAAEPDDGLAPLEWEVLDPAAEGTPVEAPEDGVLDVTDLSPPEGGTADIQAFGPDATAAEEAVEPGEFLVSADAEAALFDAVAAEPAAAEGIWSGGDLDIDWDVESSEDEAPPEEEAPPEATVEAAPPQAPAPDDDDLILDPADLAPDDWTPDESMYGALAFADEPEPEPEPEAEPEPVPELEPAEAEAEATEVAVEVVEVEVEVEADADAEVDVDAALEVEAEKTAVDANDAAEVEVVHDEPRVETLEPTPAIAPPGGDLLMELADLAPDIEPGSRRDEPSAEEALPTRTLGELYARQGLTGEAVKVFEDLVARNPADPDLRTRLDELRAQGRRTPAAEADAPAAPESPETPDQEPPVSAFLADLLAWTPDDEDPEAGPA